MIHHCGDAFRITDVDWHRDGVAFVFTDLSRDFFRGLFRIVSDDDIHSIRAQAAANVRTNASGTAGHDNCFAHDACSSYLGL